MSLPVQLVGGVVKAQMACQLAGKKGSNLRNSDGWTWQRSQNESCLGGGLLGEQEVEKWCVQLGKQLKTRKA